MQTFTGPRISDRWDKAHMAPCTGWLSSLQVRMPFNIGIAADRWLLCQVLAVLRQAVAAICGEANNESTECQGYSLYYIYRQNGMDEPADPLGTMQLQADHPPDLAVVNNQAYIVLQ